MKSGLICKSGRLEFFFFFVRLSFKFLYVGMFYGNSLLVFEQPLLMNQYSDSDRPPAPARTAKRSKDDLCKKKSNHI